ncbi:MAG: hypothetical protein IJV68_05435 [Clostridia bacterium]|nr:hypothetical protein [Clostridia bacterium]
MKNKKSFFLKIGCIVFVASFILLTSILCVIAFISADEDVDTDNISPSIVGIAGKPVSMQTIKEKFGYYTSYTEEKGNTVATVYSFEHISDIRAKRNKGEWMCLTDEEVLYLITDTVALFNTCDIIRVYDIRGEMHEYYSFSRYEDGVRIPADRPYDAMLYRIEVLHSGLSRKSFSGFGNEMFLFTGMTEYRSKKDVIYDAEMLYGYYVLSDPFVYIPPVGDGAFIFQYGRVYYIDDITRCEREDKILVY